jgi:holo-[acyl-carrier protein] synthase
MILSIGIDLTDIRRIEKALKQKGFAERVFTARERQKAESRKKAGAKTVAATYAKRFAAKEACVKALGKEGIAWHDMEITNSNNGTPRLTLKGNALKRLKELSPKARVLLTLTDAYPFALAQVMIVAND